MTYEMLKALAIVGAVWASVLAMVFWRQRHPATRRLVFAYLDSAAENGYFEPGEHWYGMSADELAYDLVCYASDCENLQPELLAPYVLEWKRRRGI